MNEGEKKPIPQQGEIQQSESTESTNTDAAPAHVYPPAPGTIPRETIKINEALQQANQSIDSDQNAPLRTFQSDVAHSITSDNVSMIKIALAEKTRREQTPQYADISKPRKSHGALITVIITLIVIGGGVAGLYFYLNKPQPPTIAEIIAPNEPELIYSEMQAMVSSNNASSDQIIKNVRTEMLADLDLGVIKRILVSHGTGSSTRNTTISEFLGLIRSRASDGLKIAFENQYFLGGFSNNPHDSFILIKINSYESAYAGMLAWEPYMEGDLGKFFPSSMLPAFIATSSVATTSTATSSASTTAPVFTLATSTPIFAATSSATSTGDATTTMPTDPLQPIRTVNQPVATFADRIIQNKDTRSLIGLDGKIKFLYTFLDTKTLLIVSSERGLKEVIARLTTGRIRR
jgi:hypothetical protein